MTEFAQTGIRLQQLKCLKANASWSTVYPKRESYRYDFVPLALDRTTIHRENPDSRSFTSYSPPYNNFPPLRHSCHPYFVIVSAIQAYEAHLSKDLTDQHWDVYARLRLIASLWEDLKGFPLDENALFSLPADQLKSSSPSAAESTDGSREVLPHSTASTKLGAEATSPNATGVGLSSTTSWSSPKLAGFIVPPPSIRPASGIAALPAPQTPSASPATKSKKSKKWTGSTTSGTPTASSSSPSNVIHSPSHAGTGVPRDPTAIPSTRNSHTNSSTSASPLFPTTPSTTASQTTGRGFNRDIPAHFGPSQNLPIFEAFTEKEWANAGIALEYQCLTVTPRYSHKSLEEWRVDAYRGSYKPWPTRAAQPFPSFIPLNPLGTSTNPQLHAQ
ncbi:uncharacterized protein STEHIDRAFT_151846 [Stereum hirsutum FP-91666 SS1]|uniref:uncharacterized protein n=1 Tax=Stereum hirsutum (strain FP-91666) TaxID=721885 RepID=UPI000440D14E|nr:uncharacterized protein STEHIDRAFT_151846 [Stereum hirsutum FP-91666 SS1]EIM92527.1 hypothetical protein STEHIDRAFT_151846 [Stereum hirsutum FP-91666 SS1]